MLMLEGGLPFPLTMWRREKTGIVVSVLVTARQALSGPGAQELRVPGTWLPRRARETGWFLPGSALNAHLVRTQKATDII